MNRKFFAGIFAILLLPLSTGLACEHMPAMEGFLEFRGGFNQTCTEPGREDSAYCPECGALVREGNEIPPSGHVWSITAEPGTQTECLRCHAAITVPGTSVPKADAPSPAPAPTSTPSPTPTSSPTLTPSPAPTPAPTLTPSPTPTPTPTPTPSPTPTPAEYFAADTDIPPASETATAAPDQAAFFTPAPEKRATPDSDIPEKTAKPKKTPLPDPVSPAPTNNHSSGNTDNTPAPDGTGSRNPAGSDSDGLVLTPGFSELYPYRRVRMHPEPGIYAPAAGILIWPLPEGTNGDSPFAQMLRNRR